MAIHQDLSFSLRPYRYRALAKEKVNERKNLILTKLIIAIYLKSNSNPRTRTKFDIWQLLWKIRHKTTNWQPKFKKYRSPDWFYFTRLIDQMIRDNWLREDETGLRLTKKGHFIANRSDWITKDIGIGPDAYSLLTNQQND